jgi:twitching motility two-component system response regulator PilH
MKTVLIVDDVQTDRELAAKVVRAAGHQVEFANDGADGVARAKTVKPALILLDVVMPGMDGFAACRQLKKDPETSGIPVVLLTTKGTEADKFWGQKQGADDHVAKPYTADSLGTVLRRFLG